MFFVLHYFHKADTLINEKFELDRKWNLPSHIFTDSEYIYPGYDIKNRQLISKLDRLAYRKVNKMKLPGDYSYTNKYIDIYLHDFEYPNDDFKGFPVRINLNNQIVTQMNNLDKSTQMDLIKFEPEELAPVFDKNMEKRTLVNLDQIPEALIASIILIEDERFFKHHGVDPKGIARAFLVNLKHMRIVQGGSTLTQQLVKNFFLYPRKSLWRKINEAFLAWRIESKYTKDEILNAYLNEIYLGQRGTASINGVGEAAKHYFAKDISQLTISECATLAGLIRAPSRYNPFNRPENAKKRRDFVLSRVYEAGIISDDQYAESLEEEIITPKLRIQVISAPYFVDFVKQELEEHFPVDILQSEGLRIFTTLDMNLQILAENALINGLNRVSERFKARLPKDKELQSCLVSITPSTGYVRAMVGGRNYATSQFNRCTQAHRQTGSTFKPFVYLTALDPKRSNQPFTPSTLIPDEEFTIESGGEDWSPLNYDKEFHGLVTVRNALEYSYNVATATLALNAGLKNIVKTAKDAGIESNLESVPALALGAFESTPIEMAYAYSVFANGGIRVKPVTVKQIVTRNGDVLERKRTKVKKMFNSKPIFLVTHILEGVLKTGTAKAAKLYGYKGIAAGKTGTTSNYRDSWFVGYTPKLLALSWVGFDDNTTTTLSGASGALPIWADFMAHAEPKGERDFIPPKGIILVKVDKQSGKLASKMCPDDIFEAFIEGTEPEETCGRDDIQDTSKQQDLF